MELIERYSIKRVIVSVYHPQVNGMIERGHQSIINLLVKLTAIKKGNWLENLIVAL